jgi:hypothetical protein
MRGMIFFVTMLLLLFSGFITYRVENPVQPDKFPDIFSLLWCAVAIPTGILSAGFMENLELITNFL